MPALRPDAAWASWWPLVSERRWAASATVRPWAPMRRLAWVMRSKFAKKARRHCRPPELARPAAPRDLASCSAMNQTPHAVYDDADQRSVHQRADRHRAEQDHVAEPA